MNPNVKVNNNTSAVLLFFFLSSSLLVRVRIHCYFSTFGKLMSGIHLVRRCISNINEVYGEEIFFFGITGGEYNRGYKKNKVFMIESNINKQWNWTVWRCSRLKLECSRSKLECNGCLYLLQSKSNSDKRRTLAYLIKFDWWFCHLYACNGQQFGSQTKYLRIHNLLAKIPMRTRMAIGKAYNVISYSCVILHFELIEFDRKSYIYMIVNSVCCLTNSNELPFQLRNEQEKIPIPFISSLFNQI